MRCVVHPAARRPFCSSLERAHAWLAGAVAHSGICSGSVAHITHLAVVVCHSLPLLLSTVPQDQDVTRHNVHLRVHISKHHMVSYRSPSSCARPTLQISLSLTHTHTHTPTHLAGRIARRKRCITGDHHQLVVGLTQLLQGGLRLLLQRALWVYRDQIRSRQIRLDQVGCIVNVT